MRLDPKKGCRRMGHAVGKRKRVEIIAKASELGIKVLNAGKLSQKENNETNDSVRTKKAKR